MLFLSLLLAQAPVLPSQSPAPDRSPQMSREELLKQLDATPGVKEKEKPFEVAVSLGRLYMGQGRYAEAKTFYAQAVAAGEAARALFVAQSKLVGSGPLPSPAEAKCKPGPNVLLATALEEARAHAKLKKSAAALACLKPGATELAKAHVALGHLQFLLKDYEGALATYGQAVQSFGALSEARYARGALLLDTKGDEVSELHKAKADFEAFLAQMPSAPQAASAKRLLARTNQAIAAKGLSHLKAQAVAAPGSPPAAPVAGQPPALSKEVIEAFENAPRTAEMEQNFQKLVDDAEDHLAHGRFTEALGNYRQVMPYQPNNPRLRAGMAWTMVRLNRQPMADNVWRAAADFPDAVAALGDTLKAKGDEEGAKALWTRLKETVPAYAPHLDGKL